MTYPLNILCIHEKCICNNNSCPGKLYVYKHYVPMEYSVNAEMKSKLSIKVVMVCNDYMVVLEMPIYSLNGSL